MKALLVGIAFAMAIVFTSQAFATDLPDCPNGKWKNGHYVCGDLQANSQLSNPSRLIPAEQLGR
jgi:hypothetical protein